MTGLVVRQLFAHLRRQLVVDELVGVFQKLLQFELGESVEILERDPVVTSNVRSRNYAFVLDQFRKLLRGAFERQLSGILCIQPSNSKHFLADAEEQIIAPLNTLRDVRQRKTELADLFQVHKGNCEIAEMRDCEI